MMPASQTRICPICEQKYCHWGLASGNNMGAVLFSDMKYLAPMMPDGAEIFKCSLCKQFVWVRDMKAEGELICAYEGAADG